MIFAFIGKKKETNSSSKEQVNDNYVWLLPDYRRAASFGMGEVYLTNASGKKQVARYQMKPDGNLFYVFNIWWSIIF